MTGSRQFERVCTNIRAAKNAGLPITLAITPNPFMEEDAESLIDATEKLEVPYAINAELFEPRQETGRAGQDIRKSVDTYIRMLKRQKEYTEETIDQGASLSSIPLREEEIPTPNSGAGTDGIENRGIRCAAGRSMFEIDWHGRMYGCSSLRSLYADPLLEPEDGFARAWK